MKVALAGHGAFGIKHLEAMAKIPGVQVISLAGSNAQSAREVATQWKIPHWTADLAESLAQPGLDAVILTTPTQMHAAQGERAGLINREFDTAFMDGLTRNPEALTRISHTDYMREAGSEGVEMVMWHVMRGALGQEIAEVYRHYHVPASNTAAGLMLFEPRSRM